MPRDCEICEEYPANGTYMAFDPQATPTYTIHLCNECLEHGTNELGYDFISTSSISPS
jgi:hypothetical protein